MGGVGDLSDSQRRVPDGADLRFNYWLGVSGSERTMGAYNWIEVQADCPACGQHTVIRCQTHVASSFDGDDSGRFCHRTYRLGERMPWFSPNETGYHRRQEMMEPCNQLNAREACYSNCTSCAAELYVVIQFRDLTPTEILDIGRESDAPEDYAR